MMAVETQSNDNILRPTDLSLKGCCTTKYSKELNNTPSPLATNQQTEENVLYLSEQHCKWKNKTMVEPKAIPSPIALVYSSSHHANASMPFDSVAKLAVLESLFSQCKGYSPTHVFDTPPINSQLRGNDKVSISQPMLDAAKGLTELQHGGVYNDRSSSTNYNASSETPLPSAVGVKTKPCKRKGGWKFHDFSDEIEGPGKRKRMYTNSRLENDILQVFQERISIKEVPNVNNSQKVVERLVIVEPSSIMDPQLIRYNTSLRLVIDRKKGIYKLQVLPHTIEQGSLTNKNKVLKAVSRMLGENGEVLCPGISELRVPMPLAETNSQWQDNDLKKKNHIKGMSKKNWLGFSPIYFENEMETTNDKYKGQWKIMKNFKGISKRSLTPPDDSSMNSAVSSTDKLLISLNKEVSETQRQGSFTTNSCSNYINNYDCLIWHTPTSSGKGKKGALPEEAKWCKHCLKKFHVTDKFAAYPRTSST